MEEENPYVRLQPVTGPLPSFGSLAQVGSLAQAKNGISSNHPNLAQYVHSSSVYSEDTTIPMPVDFTIPGQYPSHLPQRHSQDHTPRHPGCRPEESLHSLQEQSSNFLQFSQRFDDVGENQQSAYYPHGNTSHHYQMPEPQSRLLHDHQMSQLQPQSHHHQMPQQQFHQTHSNNLLEHRPLSPFSPQNSSYQTPNAHTLNDFDLSLRKLQTQPDDLSTSHLSQREIISSFNQTDAGVTSDLFFDSFQDSPDPELQLSIKHVESLLSDETDETFLNHSDLNWQHQVQGEQAAFHQTSTLPSFHHISEDLLSPPQRTFDDLSVINKNNKNYMGIYAQPLPSAALDSVPGNNFSPPGELPSFNSFSHRHSDVNDRPTIPKISPNGRGINQETTFFPQDSVDFQTPNPPQYLPHGQNQKPFTHQNSYNQMGLDSLNKIPSYQNNDMIYNVSGEANTVIGNKRKNLGFESGSGPASNKKKPKRVYKRKKKETNTANEKLNVENTQNLNFHPSNKDSHSLVKDFNPTGLNHLSQLHGPHNPEKLSHTTKQVVHSPNYNSNNLYQSQHSGMTIVDKQNVPAHFGQPHSNFNSQQKFISPPNNFQNCTTSSYAPRGNTLPSETFSSSSQFGAATSVCTSAPSFKTDPYATDRRYSIDVNHSFDANLQGHNASGHPLKTVLNSTSVSYSHTNTATISQSNLPPIPKYSFPYYPIDDDKVHSQELDLSHIQRNSPPIQYYPHGTCKQEVISSMALPFSQSLPVDFSSSAGSNFTTPVLEEKTVKREQTNRILEIIAREKEKESLVPQTAYPEVKKTKKKKAKTASTTVCDSNDMQMPSTRPLVTHKIVGTYPSMALMPASQPINCMSSSHSNKTSTFHSYPQQEVMQQQRYSQEGRHGNSEDTNYSKDIYQPVHSSRVSYEPPHVSLQTQQQQQQPTSMQMHHTAHVNNLPPVYMVNLDYPSHHEQYQNLPQGLGILKTYRPVLDCHKTPVTRSQPSNHQSKNPVSSPHQLSYYLPNTTSTVTSNSLSTITLGANSNFERNRYSIHNTKPSTGPSIQAMLGCQSGQMQNYHQQQQFESRNLSWTPTSIKTGTSGTTLTRMTAPVVAKNQRADPYAFEDMPYKNFSGPETSFKPLSNDKANGQISGIQPFSGPRSNNTHSAGSLHYPTENTLSQQGAPVNSVCRPKNAIPSNTTMRLNMEDVSLYKNQGHPEFFNGQSLKPSVYQPQMTQAIRHEPVRENMSPNIPQSNGTIFLPQLSQSSSQSSSSSSSSISLPPLSFKNGSNKSQAYCESPMTPAIPKPQLHQSGTTSNNSLSPIRSPPPFEHNYNKIPDNSFNKTNGNVPNKMNNSAIHPGITVKKKRGRPAKQVPLNSTKPSPFLKKKKFPQILSAHAKSSVHENKKNNAFSHSAIPSSQSSPKVVYRVNGVDADVSQEKINTGLVDRLVNNRIEVSDCSCLGPNYVPSETLEGPYYTQLGAAKDIPGIRNIMEQRSGVSGSAIRIEKVIYTGREGKSKEGCPVAKWIIRRSSLEEKYLCIVRQRPGHFCETAVIIVIIVAWEGVAAEQADSLYNCLIETLPKHGLETDRRCGLNEKKTCACQGVDLLRRGASFSFGCSWSMYYNGCKFARSLSARKVKLKDPTMENELENQLQTMATDVAPLYQTLAPDAFRNQVQFEEQAEDCRLGYKPGRPFSGVTSVMDFCCHSHRDGHNMNNGSTVVVNLTKHRGMGKAEDEQYHVLPLYILDHTDEHGSKEAQMQKVRSGSLEILSRYLSHVRIRSKPYYAGKRNRTQSKKNGTPKQSLKKQKLANLKSQCGDDSGPSPNNNAPQYDVDHDLFLSSSQVPDETDDKKLVDKTTQGRNMSYNDLMAQERNPGFKDVYTKFWDYFYTNGTFPPHEWMLKNKGLSSQSSPVNLYYSTNHSPHTSFNSGHSIIQPSSSDQLKSLQQQQQKQQHQQQLLQHQEQQLNRQHGQRHHSNVPFNHSHNHPRQQQQQQQGSSSSSSYPSPSMNDQFQSNQYRTIPPTPPSPSPNLDEVSNGIPSVPNFNSFTKSPTLQSVSPAANTHSSMSPVSPSSPFYPPHALSSTAKQSFLKSESPTSQTLPSLLTGSPHNSNRLSSASFGLNPSPNSVSNCNAFPQPQGHINGMSYSKVDNSSFPFLDQTANPMSQGQHVSSNHSSPNQFHKSDQFSCFKTLSPVANNKNYKYCRSDPQFFSNNSNSHPFSPLSEYSNLNIKKEVKNHVETTSVENWHKKADLLTDSMSNHIGQGVPDLNPMNASGSISQKCYSTAEMNMPIKSEQAQQNMTAVGSVTSVACSEYGVKFEPNSDLSTSPSIKPNLMTPLGDRNIYPPGPMAGETVKVHKSEGFVVPTLGQGPSEPPYQVIDSSVVSEKLDDNQDVFADPSIGGIALALCHGAVVFEVAKRELHATTALKHPNRYQPKRISLVFYQHKNLNLPHHGYEEYERKSEERRNLSEQARLIEEMEAKGFFKGEMSELASYPNLTKGTFRNVFDFRHVKENLFPLRFPRYLDGSSRDKMTPVLFGCMSIAFPTYMKEAFPHAGQVPRLMAEPWPLRMDSSLSDLRLNCGDKTEDDAGGGLPKLSLDFFKEGDSCRNSPQQHWDPNHVPGISLPTTSVVCRWVHSSANVTGPYNRWIDLPSQTEASIESDKETKPSLFSTVDEVKTVNDDDMKDLVSLNSKFTNSIPAVSPCTALLNVNSINSSVAEQGVRISSVLQEDITQIDKTASSVSGESDHSSSSSIHTSQKTNRIDSGAFPVDLSAQDLKLEPKMTENDVNNALPDSPSNSSFLDAHKEKTSFVSSSHRNTSFSAGENENVTSPKALEHKEEDLTGGEMRDLESCVDLKTDSHPFNGLDLGWFGSLNPHQKVCQLYRTPASPQGCMEGGGTFLLVDKEEDNVRKECPSHSERLSARAEEKGECCLERIKLSEVTSLMTASEIPQEWSHQNEGVEECHDNCRLLEASKECVEENDPIGQESNVSSEETDSRGKETNVSTEETVSRDNEETVSTDNQETVSTGKEAEENYKSPVTLEGSSKPDTIGESVDGDADVDGSDDTDEGGNDDADVNDDTDVDDDNNGTVNNDKSEFRIDNTVAENEKKRERNILTVSLADTFCSSPTQLDPDSCPIPTQQREELDDNWETENYLSDVVTSAQHLDTIEKSIHGEIHRNSHSNIEKSNQDLSVDTVGVKEQCVENRCLDVSGESCQENHLMNETENERKDQIQMSAMAYKENIDGMEIENKTPERC